MRKIKRNQRLTRKQKNTDKKQWYREQADMLDTEYTDVHYGYGGVSEVKRMQVNYDLFNNILDLSDFEYVCKPFGSEVGELPAQMVNRDISSGKIKAMLGMEMKRPFSWKVVATNEEATTRREQEEFGRIREYVIDEIVRPIREQNEMKYMEQTKGQKLSQEEQEQIRQKIAQETKSQTPEEVKKYMMREHQDPAEALSHQLLQYLIKKLNIKRKFNKLFKHALLSAKEIMYVGIFNGEPCVWNVNSKRFNYDKSPDLEFVEDGEWATQEYRMTPSEIVKYFGSELTKEETSRIYEEWSGNRKWIDDELDFFKLDERYNDYDDSSSISVLHCVWKSLRKIGFLTYLDENGKKQMMMVDEDYRLNRDVGELKIEWEWIPEVYETWKVKVGEPIYLNMRPIPGQFKDLNNLYHCKLPYYGAIHDNLNSEATSLMDRLKVYQYYYNILWYKFELLAATDKGKKVLMNINSIPDSAGIDVTKWQYFLESTPYMWYDPNEEGTGYADANTVAKVIDLSYAGQMNQYIEMMEYVRSQSGRSVGITDNVEGQIGSNDAVRNTQQSLVQSSHILEPYFELHNYVKGNILQALLETAKVAYSENPPENLNYVLDDMSVRTLKVDTGLLDGSTLGLFISNSSKAEEAMNTIRQLSHAAMQNQKAELSDVVSLIRQEGIVEAEETLKAAEQERRDQETTIQENRNKSAEKVQELQNQREKEKEQFELTKIEKEYDRKEKLEIIKGSLLGASFNPDADKDNDGVNDFIEIAKQQLDTDIKQNKNQLEKDKFEHQKEMDKRKIEQGDKKLKQEEAKFKAKKSKNI